MTDHCAECARPRPRRPKRAAADFTGGTRRAWLCPACVQAEKNQLRLPLPETRRAPPTLLP